MASSENPDTAVEAFSSTKGSIAIVQGESTQTATQSDGPLARTPSLSSLALTEYSARPTPAADDRETHVKRIVPDEFLLPNGTPDVSLTPSRGRPESGVWRLIILFT